jgi:hypothetical protein
MDSFLLLYLARNRSLKRKSLVSTCWYGKEDIVYRKMPQSDCFHTEYWFDIGRS